MASLLVGLTQLFCLSGPLGDALALLLLTFLLSGLSLLFLALPFGLLALMLGSALLLLLLALLLGGGATLFFAVELLKQLFRPAGPLGGTLPLLLLAGAFPLVGLALLFRLADLLSGARLVFALDLLPATLQVGSPTQRSENKPRVSACLPAAGTGSRYTPCRDT